MSGIDRFQEFVVEQSDFKIIDKDNIQMDPLHFAYLIKAKDLRTKKGEEKKEEIVLIHKMIEDDPDNNANISKNFLRELDFYVNIRPYIGIPKFHGYFFAPEKSIVTEYLPNGSLANFYNQLNDNNDEYVSKWTDTFKAKLAFGIACTMMHLHSFNAVHRYLRPDVIFFDKNDYPKVTEFALSKIQIADSGVSDPRVRVNAFYVSPEVVRDEEISNKSDVYSYGAVLLSIVHGTEYKFKRDMDDRFQLPDDKTSSKLIIGIIKNCTNPEPKERPSFAQIVKALKDSNKLFPNTDQDEYLNFVNQYMENVEVSKKDKPLLYGYTKSKRNPKSSTKKGPRTTFAFSAYPKGKKIAKKDDDGKFETAKSQKPKRNLNSSNKKQKEDDEDQANQQKSAKLSAKLSASSSKVKSNKSIKEDSENDGIELSEDSQQSSKSSKLGASSSRVKSTKSIKDEDEFPNNSPKSTKSSKLGASSSKVQSTKSIKEEDEFPNNSPKSTKSSKLGASSSKVQSTKSIKDDNDEDEFPNNSPKSTKSSKLGASSSKVQSTKSIKEEDEFPNNSPKSTKSSKLGASSSKVQSTKSNREDNDEDEFPNNSPKSTKSSKLGASSSKAKSTKSIKEDDEDDENEQTNKSQKSTKSSILGASSSKVKSTKSIRDDNEEDEDEQTNKSQKSTKNSKLGASSSKVKSTKSIREDSDEDELPNKSQKSTKSSKLGASSSKVKSTKSIRDDEEDEDELPNKSQKSTKSSKLGASSSRVKSTKSIKDDEEDEDELPKSTKSSKLGASSSRVKSTKSIKDDEEDEDELPKSTKSSKLGASSSRVKSTKSIKDDEEDEDELPKSTKSSKLGASSSRVKSTKSIKDDEEDEDELPKSTKSSKLGKSSSRVKPQKIDESDSEHTEFHTSLSDTIPIRENEEEEEEEEGDEHDFEALKYKDVRKKADQGDVYSMIQSGRMLQKGQYGAPVDLEESFKLYQKAADKGHPIGLFNYAICKLNGTGTEVDEDEAYRAMKEAAQPGKKNSQAMDTYGEWLLKKDSTPKGKNEALKYFLNAMKYGNSRAIFNAAKIYESFDKKDEAKRYYQDAGELGILVAYNNYALMLLKDTSTIKEGILILRQNALRKCPESLYNLGHIELEGSFGYKKDIVSAINHIRAAAHAGHAQACFTYGRMLARGEYDVEKNMAKAAYYYKIAANKGNLPAMVNLGTLLQKEDVDGVDQDLEKAAELFKMAADKGDKKAMEKYASCLEDGIGVEEDLELAEEYRNKANKKK